MKNYIVYTNAGVILRTGVCPQDSLLLQAVESDSYVTEGIANDVTQWVDNGTVKDKEEFPAIISTLTLEANGLDSVSILGLPTPCTIKIDDNVYEVEDGEFEFTTDLPGTYKIKAESFPYLPKEWEVTAI